MLTVEDNVETISLSNIDTRSKLFDTKSDWILLNVGGKHFLTTRSTLLKEESFLGRLCQSNSDLKTDLVSERRRINYSFMFAFVRTTKVVT